ncbi:hypothetical protein TorRG33x02_312250 [Trema orientale]|uniref:Uncharacterized protein n=1 Tax=Trema orientale TaxID=63057 RepID=A0A2P5BQP0_TREOI|nr:hypothetical protein TorRG33x02_312250 [Trema orientale]
MSKQSLLGSTLAKKRSLPDNEEVNSPANILKLEPDNHKEFNSPSKILKLEAYNQELNSPVIKLKLKAQSLEVHSPGAKMKLKMPIDVVELPDDVGNYNGQLLTDFEKENLNEVIKKFERTAKLMLFLLNGPKFSMLTLVCRS